VEIHSLNHERPKWLQILHGPCISDMDPFNKLPTEIVLCILHHTTDFVGLDSLLCVSPWIRAVFQASALQITEDILAGCPYTWRLESLFRTSTLIRTPAFQCSTFHEFHKRTRDTPAFIKAWNDDQFSHSKTLRSMIRVAARVQRLSCAVISTMLNFCASLGSLARFCLQVGRDMGWHRLHG
jgi:hypothetical protein